MKNDFLSKEKFWELVNWQNLREVDAEGKNPKTGNIDSAKDVPFGYLNGISNYDKVIKVYAWVLKFVKWLSKI